MKHLLFLLLPLLLALLLWGPAASAEDVCVLWMNDTTFASTDCSYIRACCTLPGDSPVMLTVSDAWGGLVYQRDYGLCSGDFRSEDVYLRLIGGETTYIVTLQTGTATYRATVLRKLPRLMNNEACSAGYPLANITGRDTRATVTLIDVNAVAARPLTVTLHASGVYDLGTVTFSIHDGSLLVDASLHPGIDGDISSSSVCVATSSVAAVSLADRRFSGPQGRLGTSIDLQGAPYAAVYVRLTVSFDPSNLSAPVTTDPAQQSIWRRLVDQTDFEAVG